MNTDKHRLGVPIIRDWGTRPSNHSSGAENLKFQAPNIKQIPITEIRMTETTNLLRIASLDAHWR
jgi:hypothetical protein